MDLFKAQTICLEVSRDVSTYCEAVYEQALKEIMKLEGVERYTAIIRDALLDQQQNIINNKRLMIEHAKHKNEF